LDKWDEVASKRSVLGIGGIDVHAIPYRIGPFYITIFPYKVQLQSILTHLVLKEPLPKDFSSAKEVILKSLKECRAYFANHRWGNPYGFKFYAVNGKEIAQIGESIEQEQKLDLYVELPHEAEIVIILNGKEIIRKIGKKEVFRVNKHGVVRIEVYKNKKGWIFSNHIRIIPQQNKKPIEKNIDNRKQIANDEYIKQQIRADKIHQGKKPNK